MSLRLFAVFVCVISCLSYGFSQKTDNEGNTEKICEFKNIGEYAKLNCKEYLWCAVSGQKYHVMPCGDVRSPDLDKVCCRGQYASGEDHAAKK